MFGRETFIVRVAEDAMAPRVRVGDYVWIVPDEVWIVPDEPAADGRLVAVRDPGRGGETVVRLLVERDGRRLLRALDERCPGAPSTPATKPTSGASWCSRETQSERHCRPRALRIGEGACMHLPPRGHRVGSPIRPRAALSGGEAVPTTTPSGRAISRTDRYVRTIHDTRPIGDADD